MLRVCIASIQNVERSLLLLVVSASDILLHTIKFYYVVFSSVYWSMLQAATNKHSMVCRRLCNLHCMVVGNRQISDLPGAPINLSYQPLTDAILRQK